MFQDISQSLVLIAFVWGPLVNGGIRKGTVAHVCEHKGAPCTETCSTLRNMTRFSDILASISVII